MRNGGGGVRTNAKRLQNFDSLSEKKISFRMVAYNGEDNVKANMKETECVMGFMYVSQ